MADMSDITRLLQSVEAGREEALDELMKLVYDDLERMARSHLRRHFGGHASRITLEPAALVNESFMRLIRQRATYDNRGHFFSIATRMMLRVLIDYRRRKAAAKRGGPDARITLVFDEGRVPDPGPPRVREIDVEPLLEALGELETLDPRKADVIKMRVVWGLGNDEIAQSLGVSRPTVERDWRFAKAWLAEKACGPP